MKFEPLFSNVLVKRSEAVEEATAGGIILPQSAQTKSNEGEIVAVGPGRVVEGQGLVKTTVKVGDKVLMPEYAGLVVKLPEGEFLLLREDELLGIFRESVSEEKIPF